MYIIVKYAEDLWPKGAPLEASIYDTYTAREVGMDKEVFASVEEAEPWLSKLKEFNPTVHYGIVPLVKRY